MTTETRTLGPADGSIEIRTHREGVAARAGHDLIIDVADWSARLQTGPGGVTAIELDADPGSLQIRDGLGGVKPLSDRDRAEIRRNIAEKVLGTQTIAFRSASVREEGDGLEVEGELTMAGSTRPLSARVRLHGGRAEARLRVAQTAWGIKPYRGLMGALRVADEVEVRIEVRVDG